MRAFLTALQITTRFRTKEPSADYGSVNLLLPIAGAVIGGVLWVCASLITELASFGAGAVIGAILLPLLYVWGTQARNLSGLLWLIDQWALPEEALDRSHFYWRVTGFQLAVLVKIALIGLLLYAQQSAWLLVMVVLSHAGLAELCRPGTETGDEQPLGRWGHWILAALTVVVVSVFNGTVVAGVLAIIISWLLVPVLGRGISRETGILLEESGKRAIVELVEYAVLFVAVLFFYGS